MTMISALEWLVAVGVVLLSAWLTHEYLRAQQTGGGLVPPVVFDGPTIDLQRDDDDDT